jgi:predicted amidohydrolase
MSRSLTVAAAQYPLDALPSFAAYESKVRKWVAEAAGRGAQLLVFPEYASMELAAIGDRGHDLQGSIDAVSDFLTQIADVHARFAKEFGVTIIAGSAPSRRNGKTYNVAQIASRDGRVVQFDKIMPTPWERDPWHISGGRTLKVFDLGDAKVGLVICYDIEFPLLARALVEAGAEIIVAPSNTETEWGYWRVRHGAQARALENQIYTVQSPTVGPATFCAAVENNVGMAGIFGPPDRGLPFDGVIALGEMNQPQWVIAKLDLDLLHELREQGGVRTFAHWQEQPGATVLPQAELIDFT